ncbi:hypothetical protein FE257_010675 [Aspergillus nanangensis]|uniref:Uncharacterized protein n=1 Tax=Aspergillus nanangensis TaxID=2582783 RepID=A0AAD4GR13_ASPNN|nr:hypothetical protein FE257_010675 [Aspergillus nanangensis]
MSNSSPRSSAAIAQFQHAMESVYGDITTIAHPQRWNPPERSGGHRGRYLWTDAFGVINFITLHKEATIPSPRAANNAYYLTLAHRLVETVHEVLGRTRDNNHRLPGATDDNPLGGGLRIGKIEDSGPDGDGQYHHYLTMWMFALNRLSVATGNPLYNQQAVALAKAIHPRFFVNRQSEEPRMVWKMAMDLSGPLVASEGNLDPIDGYVVFRLLQAAASEAGLGAVLQEEIADYRRVMQRKGEQFVSSDPLDLGMTLWTAHWFTENELWASRLSGRCCEQIYNLFEVNRYLERSVKYRLAFREFGACMGMRCMLNESRLQGYARQILDSWDVYMEKSLSADITRDDLRPITRVMYATALLPGGTEPQPSVEE